MWLDRINQIKNEKGFKTRTLAERTNLPERTIARILSGETEHPYIDTILSIINALECSLEEIFIDTKAVISNNDLMVLQDKINALTKERDDLIIEKNELLSKISAMNEKLIELSSEVKVLNREIEHKEEIIAIHNHYSKIKSKK